MNFFREKNLTMPKKLKGGPFGIFQHPFCPNTSKNWRGPFGEFFFRKKVSQCRKNWKLLVSPGIVCYTEKEEKPFWFSSLGQMIQFGTIKFRRTFKNYFGQFVWIEKKVTIIVAFDFMKRRLKNLEGLAVIIDLIIVKRNMRLVCKRRFQQMQLGC